MGREIRTREVRRELKVLDRAEHLAGAVKEGSIRIKELEERPREGDAPTAYAGEQLETGIRRGGREAAQQAQRQAQYALRTVRKAKEQKQKRDESESGTSGAAQVGTPEYGQAQAAQGAGNADERKDRIRTKERSGKGGKETEKVTAGKGAKSGRLAGGRGQQALSPAQRAVKQGENFARNSMQAARRRAGIVAGTPQRGVAAIRQAGKLSAVIARTLAGIGKGIGAAVASIGGIAGLLLLLVLLFGGAVSMSDGNHTAAQPVSEEVLAYEPLIRQYALKYDVGEYVELIKAVMMQESGGRGLDPMQSSEGPFNTRYPKQPNGITDPDYSIDCGVQELKSCLQGAGAENPMDMEKIRLALQSYNFGNGYLIWAVGKYGGYSEANAREFSEMMAQRLGWASYGDTEYVPHVLRYYSYGRFPSGGGNQAIVAVAASQVGNQGGAPYWSWYGFDSRVEWCACFVSWCADQCGYLEDGTMPKFALCTDGVKWFQERGRWRDRSYVPQAGDIIFFDWNGDGRSNHVGIVEKVEGGRVWTIEGNNGDECRRVSYNITDSSILGYGVA